MVAAWKDTHLTWEGQINEAPIRGNTENLRAGFPQCPTTAGEGFYRFQVSSMSGLDCWPT